MLALTALTASAKGVPALYSSDAPIPGLSIINNAGSKFNSFKPDCIYFANPQVNNVDEAAAETIINYVGQENTLVTRVSASNTRADRENAENMTNKENFLKENSAKSQAALASNYVLVLEPGEKDNTNWTLYQISVPGDAFDYMLTKGSAKGLGAKAIEVSSGVFKSGWDVMKCQQKFGLEAPAFALTADVVKTKSHNLASRIGQKDVSTLSNGDRFIAYTVVADNDGNPVSKKRGVYRLAHVSQGSMRDVANDSSLFERVAGLRTVSARNGDVLVYSPDNKMSAAVAGTYGKNAFGVRVDWDWLNKITRMGFTHNTMVTLGVDFIHKMPKDTYMYAGIDKQNNSGSNDGAYDPNNVMKINAGIMPYLRIGYGFGIHFASIFELRPYAQIGVNMPMALCLKSEDIYDVANNNPDATLFVGDLEKPASKVGIGISGTVGARFMINISYPLQGMVGCDYTYSYWADDFAKNFNKYILTGDGLSGSRTSVFSIYAGLRWCF